MTDRFNELIDLVGLDAYGADWWQIKERGMQYLVLHPEKLLQVGQRLDQLMGGMGDLLPPPTNANVDGLRALVDEILSQVYEAKQWKEIRPHLFAYLDANPKFVQWMADHVRAAVLEGRV